MNHYRYTLEKYKGMATKYRCPNCEHDKKFTRYIDTTTNEHLHSTVGKCDRSDNCGLHYTPKQYFTDNNILSDLPIQAYNFKPKQLVAPKEVNTSFIPFDTFKAHLGNSLDNNNFVKYLNSLFGNEATKKLIERYYISTSNLWNGSTIFWQIDTEKKIRSGKILLYNAISGKRDKTKNSWVHSALKLTDFNLKQCFFGAHLLTDKSKTVAIVEGDKTAVLMSYYLPQYIWLSSSGKEGLNADKFKLLQGRTVILFPDLSKADAKINCFELWSKKANEFKHFATIKVSDYLQRVATDTEKMEGLDIADYYIKYNSNTPVLEVQKEVVKIVAEKFIHKVEVLPVEPPNMINNWNTDILELETFFNYVPLPIEPIKLNNCSTITNVSVFIASHFATAKANNGNPIFLIHLNRLQELKQMLTNANIN